ncbi:MAG: hypothetical protein FJ255_01725 [Phycisphaerae bacterium]|nr:hypothetical protein [Phycisphaerae bacterium]
MKFKRSTRVMGGLGVLGVVASVVVVGVTVSRPGAARAKDAARASDIVTELEHMAVRFHGMPRGVRGPSDAEVRAAADAAIMGQARGTRGWSTLLLACADKAGYLPCADQGAAWLGLVAAGGESPRDRLEGWKRLGWARSHSGDVAGAIVAFERALAMFGGTDGLRPSDHAMTYASISNGLANRLGAVGQHQRAREVHEAGLAVAAASGPDDMMVGSMRRNHASLLMRVGEPLAAAAQLRLVVARRPASAQEWPDWLREHVRLAQLLELGGEQQAGIEALRGAWEEEEGRGFPESADVGWQLCEQYSRAGRAAESLNTAAQVCDLILARRAEWLAASGEQGAGMAGRNVNDALRTMASRLQGTGEMHGRPELTAKGLDILIGMSTDPVSRANLVEQRRRLEASRGP